MPGQKAATISLTFHANVLCYRLASRSAGTTSCTNAGSGCRSNIRRLTFRFERCCRSRKKRGPPEFHKQLILLLLNLFHGLN